MIFARLVPMQDELVAERVAKYLMDNPAIDNMFLDREWPYDVRMMLSCTGTPEELNAYARQLIVLVAGLLMSSDIDMYREYGTKPRDITCRTLDILGGYESNFYTTPLP